MSTFTEVSNTSFAAEVLNATVPVIVDFWAPWCGPCRAIAPTLEAVEKDLHGQVKVVKINIDEQPGLAVQFGVQSIPTLLFFKNGKPVQRIVGVQPKDALVKRVLAL